MDGLSRQTPVSQAEGGGGPTVQYRLHAALALAVVTSLGVDAFSAREVAGVGVSALINVYTLGQIDKFLVLTTRDDVSSDQSEALVTPHTHTVLKIQILPFLSNQGQY